MPGTVTTGVEGTTGGACAAAGSASAKRIGRASECGRFKNAPELANDALRPLAPERCFANRADRLADDHIHAEPPQLGRCAAWIAVHAVAASQADAGRERLRSHEARIDGESKGGVGKP